MLTKISLSCNNLPEKTMRWWLGEGVWGCSWDNRALISPMEVSKGKESEKSGDRAVMKIMTIEFCAIVFWIFTLSDEASVPMWPCSGCAEELKSQNLTNCHGHFLLWKPEPYESSRSWQNTLLLNTSNLLMKATNITFPRVQQLITRSISLQSKWLIV